MRHAFITDYYCNDTRVDLKLDLGELCDNIRRDNMVVSNKFFGISVNRATPRVLHCRRGVSRMFKHALYRNARSFNSHIGVRPRGGQSQQSIQQQHHHDVAVTMEAMNFFRICGELQMESEFIEIR